MKTLKSAFLMTLIGLCHYASSQTLIGEASLDQGGTIFEYNIAQNQFSTTATLSPAKEGDVDFYRGSSCGCNGKFYGRTFTGAANAKGAIYEYTPETKTIKVIYNFPASEATEYTVTVCGKNNLIYGAGINENGSYLFELNPTNQSFKSYPANEFDLKFATLGSAATNDKIYFVYQKLAPADGMNYGMLEFDPTNKTISNKISLPIKGGFGPRTYNRLSDVGNNKLAGTLTITGFGSTIFVYDYAANTAKYIELHKEGKYGEAFGNMVAVEGKVFLFNRGADNKNTTVYSVDLNTGKFVEEYAFGKLPTFDNFACAVNGTKIYGFSLRDTKLFAYDTKEKKATIIADTKGKVTALEEFMLVK